MAPEDLGRADAGIGPTKRFIPGEVVVRFERGVTGAERAGLREEQGAELEERSSIPRVELVELGRGASVREAVAGFEDERAVEYAEPNFVREAELTPDDDIFQQELLWGLHNTGQTILGNAGTPDADIDAPEAWNMTTGSSSVTVAVIDTGIAYDHVDLNDNIWMNVNETPGNGIDDDGNGFVDDVRGWDFVNLDANDPHLEDDDPLDENGHGTHVAGTIGAEGNNTLGVPGVNWDVSLMPLRILDATGTGSSLASAEAIRYAGDNGARVVNGSYAGPGISQAEKDEIDAAPDTLFVFAAGNDGTNNDVNPQTPCNIDSPNIICVAASNQNDQLAGFSNFGATSVDLAAPGTSIASTFPFEPSLFSEDFETGLDGWMTGGTPSGWGLTTAFSLSGTQSLTDSPGANYVNNADNFAHTTTSFDLTPETDCELVSPLDLNTAGIGDFVEVQASIDGTTWIPLSAFAGNAFVASVDQLGAPFEGDSSVFVGYRFESDATGTAVGVFVDDVLVHCRDDEFVFFNGTSMATPHVAGTAALLFEDVPGASPIEVRDRILNSVDQKSSLCGKVATAGRLNAARALNGDVNPPPCPPAPAAGDTAPPDTQITEGPKNKTKRKRATFEFVSTEPGSSFDCTVDGRSVKAPCTSPFTVKVKKGRHTFQVRATDASGNPDPSPASDGWKRKKKKKKKK